MRNAVLSALLLGTGLLAVLPRLSAAAPASTPRVNVILWFDTEDYILPADDDACKRLGEILTDRGVRATFKMVGEKARVLERRGRQDVIAALSKHDIAYHSDFHSVHPTPTEYLAECGWSDGIAEFVRREGQGALDVRRIFGVQTLSCYGQPGSSWAPQAVAGMKQIGVAAHGIPCYVDEGSHVGLNHAPFWYAGALNVYKIGPNCTRMELHDPAAVAPAKKAVAEVAQRLAKDGGGLISIYYHPCEWVHRQFWDGVNFSRGANPPREEWKLPPQRTAEETDGAFRRFAEYVEHIRQIPGVHFITASDLPVLYPDATTQKGATAEDLKALASRLVTAKGGVDFQVLGQTSFSAADQFELLLRTVGNVMEHGKPVFPIQAQGVFGPDAAPPKTGSMQLRWPAFRDATKDALNFVQTQHRIPARVFIGADPVAPADFLASLASVYNFYLAHGKLPLEAGVVLEGGHHVLPERHIAQDTPGLFGGWVIHKKDFRAPRLMELARLQAWTLKPALRAPLPSAAP